MQSKPIYNGSVRGGSMGSWEPVNFQEFWVELAKLEKIANDVQKFYCYQEMIYSRAGA